MDVTHSLGSDPTPVCRPLAIKAPWHFKKKKERKNLVQLSPSPPLTTVNIGPLTLYTHRQMSPSPKGAILVLTVKNFKCKYSHTVHIMDCPLCLKVSLEKCHLFLRQTTCNVLIPHSSSIHGLLIYFKVLSSKKIRLVCIVQFTCQRPKLGSHTYGLLI